MLPLLTGGCTQLSSIFHSKKNLNNLALVMLLMEDLLQQGVVSPSDIIILTPYQRQYIRYLTTLNMLKDAQGRTSWVGHA